jgi:hypothetical protein
MKQHINTRQLRTGRFYATTTTVAGLILLIASTILSLNPQFGLASFPVLILGVIFSTLGIRLSREWTRTPYTHEVLLAALKGLPADTIFLNYWKPATHLLLTIDAIYVLIPFRGEATITVSPTTWRDSSSSLNQLRRSLALETVAHATRSATAQTAKVSQWLASHFPNNPFPIVTCIVVTSNNASLYVEAQTAPLAAYTDKRKPNLKALIRNQPKSDGPIPIEEIASLIQTQT